LACPLTICRLPLTLICDLISPPLVRNSVATVDYDYSKAYGGADTSVVSDAGGTMGENTRDTGSQIAAATAARAALGASFDSGEGGKDPNVKEEVIEISAPAGKLGVVIGM
jgi:hypothetical protein